MMKFDLSSTELNEFQNFGHYLKKYHSNESCINYINAIKSERKILRVLTELESLSNFHVLIQIQSIYLFLKESLSCKFNKENYSKLIDQFTDIDELISRLRKDILLTYRNDLSMNTSSINEITIEQSLTNLHGNSIMLLYNHLLVYYLIKSQNLNMNDLKKTNVRTMSY